MLTAALSRVQVPDLSSRLRLDASPPRCAIVYGALLAQRSVDA